MAGGIGSRFWPESRMGYPKQFIDILGTGKSLIQWTYLRFLDICPKENIYFITNQQYIKTLQDQIPEVAAENIISEPSRKNTAPCAAYFAHRIYEKNPNANIIMSPADHLIMDEKGFTTTALNALEFVSKNDALLTLGIKPTRPDTGYGYIQYDEDTETEGVYKVKTFTEKPSYDLAKTFLDSGDFLWNSGIFIWDVRCIVKAFELYQGDMNDLFLDGKGVYNTSEEKDFIASAYSQSKSISIDYAIMEHAENVQVIPASFGWSDLGTWMSLWEKHDKDENGNAFQGNNVMMYDSENCLVAAPQNKLVILQGLDDLCIVDTGDVLMICRMEEEQKIKEINYDVRKRKGEQYL